MDRDDILLDAGPAELRHRAMDNLEALFRTMARLDGSHLDEGGPVRRHLAFPSNPMFKGAWATRIDGDADAAIDDTTRWFRERGAPFFFWWTDGRTQPADLGRQLEVRGLLSMEQAQHALAPGIVQKAAGAPVMSLDLRDANAGLVRAVPHDFRIEEVADDAALLAFRAVFLTTYQIPEWAGQGWVDATRAFGIGRSPWRMYVGWLGDQPVATNMLFCGAGVASVYAVATLPSAQRRGIGAAITLQPLLEALALGYRYALLFATEEGFPVYRRLGFADTGERINRYLWRAG